MLQTADLERAVKMANARREMRRLLVERLPERADQRAVLLDLLGDIESESDHADVPAPEGRSAPPQVNGHAAPAPAGKAKSLTQTAAELLAASPNGATLDEIGAKLYPGSDPANQKHKARGIMRWLSKNRRAKQSRSGRWGATLTSEAPVKSKAGKMTQSVLAFVGRSGVVSSGEVVAELRKSKPDINPTHVYNTIFRLCQLERLTKSERDGKAVYSISGGKNK